VNVLTQSKYMGKILLLVILQWLSICCASVTDIAARADAIVVGGFATRVEASDSIAFDLKVDRIVKGEHSIQSAHVFHNWKRAGVVSDGATRTVSGKVYGIWFLIHSDSVTWDVLPVNGDGFIFSLCLTAAPILVTPYQYSPQIQSRDALVYEIAAGFESTPGTAEQMLLPRSLTGSAVQTVLNRFANSSNVALRSSGLAGLLSRSQEGSLTKLQELWPSIQDDPGSEVVISELRNSYRDPRPSCILRLIEIANASSTNPGLRSAAVRAITALHTKESLPFAAALLDSSDPEERMRGVFALSSFANGCPSQTPETGDTFLQCNSPSRYRNQETMAAFAFRRGPDEEELRLFSFWRNWWNTNKYSLTD
jgi:hypothetical protein